MANGGRSAKLAAAALISALLLQSCGSAGTQIRTETAEYETDTAIITCESAEFSRMKNKELEERLNKKYACTKETAEERINGAQKRAKADSAKYSYSNHIEAVENDNGILSILNSEYVYTGGAHGTLTRTAENINLNTGEEMTLSSFFMNDGYAELLERKMNELITKFPDEYAELWEKPAIGEKEERNFYIDGGKLIIYFQPYELSYYARGVIEFPIPLSELGGTLKEEYLPKAKDSRA